MVANNKATKMWFVEVNYWYFFHYWLFYIYFKCFCVYLYQIKVMENICIGLRFYETILAKIILMILWDFVGLYWFCEILKTFLQDFFTIKIFNKWFEWILRDFFQKTFYNQDFIILYILGNFCILGKF